MKISDETVNAWSKILKKVSNSILILKSSNFCSEEILMDKFKSNDVADKVKILRKADFLKHEDHLNIYRKIDLCLDIFVSYLLAWLNL